MYHVHLWSESAAHLIQGYKNGGLVPMFTQSLPSTTTMPPTRTGADHADRRVPSSPFSQSSHSNEPPERLPRGSSPVESDLEFGDESSESRWKRLYFQEHKKRENEQTSKKQKNK